VSGKTRKSFEIARQHFESRNRICENIIPAASDLSDGIFFQGVRSWYERKNKANWSAAPASRLKLAEEQGGEIVVGAKWKDDVVSIF